jgi:hypothetical protein
MAGVPCRLSETDEVLCFFSQFTSACSHYHGLRVLITRVLALIGTLHMGLCFSSYAPILPDHELLAVPCAIASKHASRNFPRAASCDALWESLGRGHSPSLGLQKYKSHSS